MKRYNHQAKDNKNVTDYGGVATSNTFKLKVWKLMGVALTLTFVGLAACKKDQAEIAEFNRNCNCAEEVSADFEIREMTFLSQPQYSTITDTILPYNKYVKFTANDDSAEYTWYIGSEIIHEQSFIRQFPDNLAGQTLPITLAVSKAPNTICFPEDDGKDSITKTVTVAAGIFDNGPFFEQGHHLWEGTFRFKDSLGNYPIKDSFDIAIDMQHRFHPDNTIFVDRIKFSNWTEQDSIFYLYDGAPRYTYRQIWMAFGNYYTWTRLHHMANGRVELECAQTTFTEIRKPYFLIGRKIN